MAVKKSNGEVGGRSIEMAEKEFILRVSRLHRNQSTICARWRSASVRTVFQFCSTRWRTSSSGPDMRRGIAELNGEGETVGGIVVVRYGANARASDRDVKKRLDQAMKGIAARM